MAQRTTVETQPESTPAGTPAWCRQGSDRTAALGPVPEMSWRQRPATILGLPSRFESRADAEHLGDLRALWLGAEVCESSPASKPLIERDALLAVALRFQVNNP